MPLELVHGRDGKFYASAKDMYVGRALVRYGEYCRREAEMLKQLCGPGDVVVDGGANIGPHTIGLAKHVGEHGHVVAIEPQEQVFATLLANVELNQLENVDCLHCGLGEARGVLNYQRFDYEAEENFGAVRLGSAPGVPVAVERLDDIFAHDRLRLLKLDVECMEVQALRGSAALIARHRPILYVENACLDESPALISHIQGLGYRLWWHTPMLFDADNFFGEKENLWPTTAAFNMLCLPRERASDVSGLHEVRDPAEHPLKASSASSSR